MERAVTAVPMTEHFPLTDHDRCPLIVVDASESRGTVWPTLNVPMVHENVEAADDA